MIKKSLIVPAVLITAQLFVSSATHAKVQKCQDAQGRWHYGNDLSGVCQDESKIQSVRNSVKTAGGSEGSSSDELKQLELKLVDQNEYLTADLETVLAPYNSVDDVTKRYDQLKASTTTELSEKQMVLEGLQQKQARLITEQETNADNAAVLIADNELRIESTEKEIAELTKELDQIEKRREKMITLFNQFSDKYGNDQVRAG